MWVLIIVGVGWEGVCAGGVGIPGETASLNPPTSPTYSLLSEDSYRKLHKHRIHLIL